MNLIKTSRRRSFFVHCPICGALQDKSEKETNEKKTCQKCHAKLKVTLIPGLLLIGFDSKILKSPDYDGSPEKNRRYRDQVAF